MKVVPMQSDIHFFHILDIMPTLPAEAQSLVSQISLQHQFPIGTMRMEDITLLADTAEHDIVPPDFACPHRAPTEPRRLLPAAE